MHTPLKSKRSILKYIIISLMISSMLFLYGCAAAKNSLAPREVYEEGMEMPAAAPEADMTMWEPEMAKEYSSYSGSAQGVKRIVLKNASLSIVVDDPAQTMDTIAKLADDLDGWVVSANLSKYTLENNVEVPHATITIRVPEEVLDEAIETIENQSDQDPLSKTINSQDVTSEYTDLQSRLRNLESAEEQLRKIMEDAVRTEDVMSVYNQLVSVREQIEVVKGQIKYYDEASALSSISVDILANEAVQPLTIGGWQPVGVAKDAIQALINTLKVLANIVIWLIIFFVPILLVFFVVFFLPIRAFIRLIKRNRARRKAKESPATIQSSPPSGGTPPAQG
ncbi:MAG: DUF4349 domain-containing protein [Anaerolineales bacterium]|nr:DUF4349 domain-containing protein [Anaerolineales bacterium]